MLKHILGLAIILSGTVLSAQVSSQNIQTDFLDELTMTEIQRRIHACYYQGDYKEGLEFSKVYNQRVAVAPLDSQKVHIVASFSLVALFYDKLGNISEALSYYRQARDVARDFVGENHQEYIVQLNNIGLIYKRLELYEKALPYQRSAFEFRAREIPLDTLNYITSAKNYASLLKDVGEEEKSITMWEDILKISAAFNTKSIPHANTLYGAGIAFGEVGRIKESTLLFKQSAQVIEELTNGNHPAYSKILSRLAGSYYSEELIDSAIYIMRTAINLDRRKYGDGNPNLYFHSAQLAGYLEENNNLEESTSLWLEANKHVVIRTKNLFHSLNEVEQSGMLNDVYVVSNGLQSYALRHPEQPDLLEIIYNNQLLYKRLLLNNKKQLLSRLSEDLDNSVRQDYQEWEQLYAIVGRQLSLPLGRQNTALDSLVNRLEELESNLANRSKIFNLQRRSPTWRDLQAQLKNDEVVLEFSTFTYQNRDKTEDEICHVVYSISTDQSTPQMTVLFEESEAPNLNSTRQVYRYNPADSATLNQLVYEPLSSVLAGKTKVFYAPDGLFHRINVQAIPVDENGTMQDYFEMHRLSSTALVLQDLETPSIPESALVFGGIDYGSHGQERASSNEEPEELGGENVSMADSWRALGGSDWGYLSWTKTEAQRISTIMKEQAIDVTLKMDRTATEETFKGAISNISEPAVLHLATHGYFFPSGEESEDLGFSGADNPLIRSGLILAGGNFAWTGGIVGPEEEDQILTAYEIAQLDLENIELVVLSACDTGLGDVKNGEGVYGLQRAFKLAGVRYVMMSLFEVPDKQTQEFMELFYGEWMMNNKEIPQAFQSAQKQLRNRYAKPFNPSLWAGFILME